MDPLAAKTLAAATGSTLTALTMTPFDVVKTRLQTQPASQPVSQVLGQKCCSPSNAQCIRQMSSLARSSYPTELVCLWEQGSFRTERVNGFADALRKIWAAEGLKGLWKGAGTTMLIGVPSSTLYMLTYDHLVHVMLPSISPSPSVTPLLSGVLARVCVSSLASPLELFRTNLQATPLSPSQPRTLSSVTADIRSLVRSQGLLSLWRGLGPTLWRDVPFSGVYWAGYEAFKGKLAQRGHSGAGAAFVSGSVSGITAALLTSPFDVLKTRRQALAVASRGRSVSSLMLLLNIARNEGVPTLFAGLTPRMAKIAPACGIMISCYEGVGGMLSSAHRQLE